jgi:hypothetical protein
MSDIDMTLCHHLWTDTAANRWAQINPVLIAVAVSAMLPGMGV